MRINTDPIGYIKKPETYNDPYGKYRNSEPVYQFTKEGKFLKLHSSRKHAALAMHTAFERIDRLMDKERFINGFRFSFSRYPKWEKK